MSLSLTLLIIWMAFLLSASGCTKPSPTKRKQQKKKQSRPSTSNNLGKKQIQVLPVSLCAADRSQSGLKCCPAIAEAVAPIIYDSEGSSCCSGEPRENKRLVQQQNELITHWRSGWIQVLWSLVSCAWSLQGLFPQGPLQGHITVRAVDMLSHC